MTSITKIEFTIVPNAERSFFFQGVNLTLAVAGQHSPKRQMKQASYSL